MYNIYWKARAKKQLDKIELKSRYRIVLAVEELKDNPFPPNSKKLVGTENGYRIRIGNYRVIYSVYRQELNILVLKLGHRKEIYRRTP